MFLGVPIMRQAMESFDAWGDDTPLRRSWLPMAYRAYLSLPAIGFLKGIIQPLWLLTYNVNPGFIYTMVDFL